MPYGRPRTLTEPMIICLPNGDWTLLVPQSELPGWWKEEGRFANIEGARKIAKKMGFHIGAPTQDACQAQTIPADARPLSQLALNVLAILRDEADANGIIRVGHMAISRRLGRVPKQRSTDSSVWYAISNLLTHGHIEVISRQHGKATIYRVLNIASEITTSPALPASTPPKAHANLDDLIADALDLDDTASRKLSLR